MEISGVRLSYQDRLLAESAARRARPEETTDLAACISAYSVHSNLANEFEQRNESLYNAKDKFQEIKGRMAEGKGRCTLKCFSLAAILTVVWGFINVRQQGNKTFFQVQNVIDLASWDKRSDFNRPFVDLVVRSGQRDSFLQSCSGPPLFSCQNRTTLNDASMILKNLNQTCLELAKLSRIVGDKEKPQRREVLQILGIGREIRDECDRFLVKLSSQTLQLEGWPELRAHVLSVNPETFTPICESIPLEQLLQVDLGLSLKELVSCFSIYGGVKGLYQLKDGAISQSRIAESRESPWGVDGEKEYVPGQETPERAIKVEKDLGTPTQVEREIEILGIQVVSGTYRQPTKEGARGTGLKEELSPGNSNNEIYQVEERPELGSPNSDIPSPPFEPLQPTASRSASETSLDNGKTLPRDEINQDKGIPVAGSSNRPIPSRNDTYVVKYTGGEQDVPRVKLTKLKLSIDDSGEEPRGDIFPETLLANQKKIPRFKRNLPPGPKPYNGGLTLTESKTHKIFKTPREFYNFKRFEERRFGNLERDGVLLFEIKNEVGMSQYEFASNPEDPKYSTQAIQGVNFLRIPPLLTTPIMQLLNSPLDQQVQERKDFKVHLGTWVRYLQKALECVGPPQPVACTLCTEGLPFVYIFYGCIDLRQHLETYHSVSVSECIELSENYEANLHKGSKERQKLKRWFGMAREVRTRLRENLKNPPPAYDPDLGENGVPWRTNVSETNSYFLPDEAVGEPSQGVRGSNAKGKGRGRRGGGIPPASDGESTPSEQKKPLLTGCVKSTLLEQDLGGGDKLTSKRVAHKQVKTSGPEPSMAEEDFDILNLHPDQTDQDEMEEDPDQN